MDNVSDRLRKFVVGAKTELRRDMVQPSEGILREMLAWRLADAILEKLPNDLETRDVTGVWNQPLKEYRVEYVVLTFEEARGLVGDLVREQHAKMCWPPEVMQP